VKKVTAVLIVYAILVIASSIFWVRYAVSKSRLTAGGNTGNTHRAANVDKINLNAKKETGNATELTGGVTDGDKADGWISDIVKSNDL
jgi:hypothetical protein